MRLSAWLPVLLLAVALPTRADMFKCSVKGGTPVYQDTPCPKGTELRDFQADPATVSVVPGRPEPGPSSRLTAPEKPPKTTTKASASARKVVPNEDKANERRHLALGMSEAEVLARVGSPDLKSGGSGRRNARWSYMPTPADPQTVTTVFFDYGKVIDVERKVVK